MATSYSIAAVKLCKRRKCAEDVQKVLTEFGCIIRLRLGVHEAGDQCSEEGLVLLQLVPGAEETPKLIEALNAVDGTEAKLIEL